MEKTNEQVAEETNEYGLPTKVEIPFEEMYFDYFECEDGDEYKEDVIAEYLSDRYGFLNRSFRYEEDEDRKVIVVSEIDWEIDEEEDVVDEFYGLTEEQYNFIIDSFRQCLTGFTYESWCDTGSSDKEEYVVEATKESCPFEIEDDGVLYDIFWDWARGLEEEDFPEPEESDDDDYFDQDFDDYEDEEEDNDDWY
jgi:hypothetical protein